MTVCLPVAASVILARLKVATMSPGVFYAQVTRMTQTIVSYCLGMFEEPRMSVRGCPYNAGAINAGTIGAKRHIQDMNYRPLVYMVLNHRWQVVIYRRGNVCSYGSIGLVVSNKRIDHLMVSCAGL